MSCITGAPLLKPSPSLQFSIPGPPAICTLQVILFFSLCTARNSSFPICLIASVLLFPAPLTAIVPPFLVPRNQGRIFFISCSSSLFSSISCVHHSLHFFTLSVLLTTNVLLLPVPPLSQLVLFHLLPSHSLLHSHGRSSSTSCPSLTWTSPILVLPTDCALPFPVYLIVRFLQCVFLVTACVPPPIVPLTAWGFPFPVLLIA